MQGIYGARLSDVEVIQSKSNADDVNIGVNIGESKRWSNQISIGSVNFGLLFAISCNHTLCNMHWLKQVL